MSPAGVVHHKYWRMMLMPTLAFSTVLLGSAAIWMVRKDQWSLAEYVLEFWLWFNLWYLSGRYIDPDWDGTTITSAEGRSTRELGLLGVFLFGISSFYAAFMNYLAAKFKIKGLFGAHRSWLTHSPIGTAIRIQFINAPMVYTYQIIQGIAASLGGRFEFAILDIIVFLIAQFLGLGWSDAIHVYLDNHYKGPGEGE